jgi:hypothetical protein
MGTYNKEKHRQIMIHVDTKNALLGLFPRLKVRTYNQALEVLITHYRSRRKEIAA